MTLAGDDLVLCSGTLARHSSFTERLAAARAGQFQAISLWGRDYQLARRSGLSDSDMRAMLEDDGLSLAELDPAWWWPPGAAEVHLTADLDEQEIFGFREAEMLAIADALGARSLNAVDALGGRFTRDQATDAFAQLCMRAAEHDLCIQLEFLPWSKVPDLRSAWEIVKNADQPNGGITIDAWHYFRSGSDDGLLETIPGSRILGVQLCDAPASPEENPVHATLHERLLPGEGALDLGSLMDSLHRIGSTAPIGIEVFSDVLHQLSPEEVGMRAGQALREVVGPHGRSGAGGQDAWRAPDR
jgi:sugar phosphate isomerase/epimerase